MTLEKIIDILKKYESTGAVIKNGKTVVCFSSFYEIKNRLHVGGLRVKFPR